MFYRSFGLIYLEDDGHLSRTKFTDLVVDLFKSYETVNFYLERNSDLGFQQFGRRHSEAYSLKKDLEIKMMLEEHNIPYYNIQMCNYAVHEIIQILGIV